MYTYSSTSNFGNALWDLIVSVLANSPWVFMALMAILAWMKRKTPAIGLQGLGAAARFALVLVRWVAFLGLGLMKPSYDVYRGMGYMFSFLTFLSLAAFALGYCWEKFS